MDECVSREDGGLWDGRAIVWGGGLWSQSGKVEGWWITVVGLGDVGLCSRGKEEMYKGKGLVMRRWRAVR